nr:MAG TPA: hypothetical protein [Bacteriophage sp.]
MYLCVDLFRIVGYTIYMQTSESTANSLCAFFFCVFYCFL